MLHAYAKAWPRYAFLRQKLPLVVKLSLLSCTLAAPTACGRRSTAAASQPKIIGGRVADEHRFMAGLAFGASDETGCGGTFVGDHLVVTAAHCLDGFDGAVHVIPGGNHPAQRQRLKVLSTYVHEDFDMKQMQNDIAVLITEPPLPGSVAPIAYNKEAAWPTDATALTVIGRGNETTIGEIFDGDLRQVDLAVVPAEACRKAVAGGDGGTVTAAQICAGDLAAGGFDSCQGDSGGPLVTFDHGAAKLVGIVSWGVNCAQPGNPGIYTRVSSQAAWIDRQLQRYGSTAAVVDLAQSLAQAKLARSKDQVRTHKKHRRATASARPRGNEYLAASVVWQKPNADGSVPGLMTLDNHTDLDLHTWKLTCPFPFTIDDLHGRSYATKQTAPKAYTVKLESPTEPAASLPRLRSMQLRFTAQGPMAKTPDCVFNQLWLPLVATSR